MTMVDNYQGVFGNAPEDSAYSSIYNALAPLGLTSLTDKAWQAYKNGASIQTILADLVLTQEFKDRFPAYDALRLQGTPVTVGQIIEYEQTGKQLMRQFGMPAQFSSNLFLQNAMSQNIGLPEITQRLQLNRERVFNMPASVRAAYNEMFPGQGDGILTATLFLEFDESLPELEQKVAQAQIVGFGRDAGFDFSRSEAAELAGVATDPNQIRGVIGEIGQNRGIFRETISEGEDLRAERQGVQAALGTGTAGAEIEKRRQQRSAGGRANVGGGISERGAVGYGSTR